MTIIPQKLLGDSRQTLKVLPEKSVHCCITSPPYWGLRSYLPKDHPLKALEIGCEPTFELYLDHLLEVFREVRRVLRDDGTLFVNMGDAYSNDTKWGGSSGGLNAGSAQGGYQGQRVRRNGDCDPKRDGAEGQPKCKTLPGLKPKDLIMMPARVAMALQAPYEVPSCVQKDTDKAWLAAMFDGEGCIGIRRYDSFKDGEKKQDGFVIYTVVTNNDIELLDRCIEITGLGSARLKQAAGDTDSRLITSRRDSYGWRLDGNKAVDVIRAIYPFLIAKKKQACVAYTLDCLNKAGREARGNGPVPPELQGKREFLKQLINKLNQREVVDIPSWVEEPKPKIEPGWYLRSMIPWIKKNAMPESVTDRPASAVEYVFMFSKSETYFWDRHAVMMQSSDNTHPRRGRDGSFMGNQVTDETLRSRAVNPKAQRSEDGSKQNPSWSAGCSQYIVGQRNRRNSDWLLESFQGLLLDENGQPLALIVNPKGTSIDHFATYPEKLVQPFIIGGTSERGCCATCGKPWERMLSARQPTIGRSSGNKERKFRDEHGGNEERRTHQGFGFPYEPGVTITAGWQPGCECHGKLTRVKVMLAPRLTKEEVSAWGADSNGEYFGKPTKDYAGNNVQDASAIKARIIRNATQPREVNDWLYSSPLALADHPVKPCTILDPFSGAGTTAKVAADLGRCSITCELNPEYFEAGKLRDAQAGFALL